MIDKYYCKNDKVVKMIFQCFSEIYLNFLAHANESNRIKTGKCAYWKGTILYLSLPLSNPKTFEDIINSNSINPNININWS